MLVLGWLSDQLEYINCKKCSNLRSALRTIDQKYQRLRLHMLSELQHLTAFAVLTVV